MKLSVRNLVLIPIFAALTAVGAFSIPIPYIPITLQFFFSALSGIILGSKRGILSQIVYVAIGLAGFPIFAKGGGIGYVFQPSFGYLLGFIANAYIIGKITENLKKATLIKVYGAVLLGLLSVYAIGIPYFYIIYNFYIGKAATIGWVIKVGLLPFLLKDMILGLVLSVLAMTIMPRLNTALQLGRDNFTK